MPKMTSISIHDLQQLHDDLAESKRVIATYQRELIEAERRVTAAHKTFRPGTPYEGYLYEFADELNKSYFVVTDGAKTSLHEALTGLMKERSDLKIRCGIKVDLVLILGASSLAVQPNDLPVR